MQQRKKEIQKKETIGFQIQCFEVVHIAPNTRQDARKYCNIWSETTDRNVKIIRFYNKDI